MRKHLLLTSGNYNNHYEEAPSFDLTSDSYNNHNHHEEAPSFDLTSDKEFSKERKEGEGGKGVCEELLHQGDKF